MSTRTRNGTLNIEIGSIDGYLPNTANGLRNIMGLNLRSEGFKSKLDLIVAGLLILAIVPSLTALSAHLVTSLPSLSRYLGPINFIKLFSPFLIFYLFTKHQQLPKKIVRIVFLTIFVGTVATLISGYHCHFPPSHLREWFVMVLASIAALCLFCLPVHLQNRVVLFWIVIVDGFALLEIISPTSIDWLYANVFDPDTRYWDQFEVGGGRALTGVFGRQSLAKLLLWTPWLAATFHMLNKKTPSWKWLILIAVNTGAILATSQRGPFVAGLGAIGMFTIYAILRTKNFKLLTQISTLLAVTLLAAWIFIPKQILLPRLKSMIGTIDHPQSPAELAAESNKKIRLKITQFSLQQIINHPLGNCCIANSEFEKAGISPGHSHNLFLEQFRSRGWVWGIFHLLLWISAATFCIKIQGPGGFYSLGLMTSIWISGMFDHPWFVLNQALPLWTGLMWPFYTTYQIEKKTNSS